MLWWRLKGIFEVHSKHRPWKWKLVYNQKQAERFCLFLFSKTGWEGGNNVSEGMSGNKEDSLSLMAYELPFSTLKNKTPSFEVATYRCSQWNPADSHPWRIHFLSPLFFSVWSSSGHFFWLNYNKLSSGFSLVSILKFFYQED